jgi:integrase
MGLYKRIERDKKGKVISRGKVWWISYVVAGRQKRESSHSTNKRVAKNVLALRQAQVLEGRLQLPASKPPKFEDWSEKFLREEVPHPNTNERYRYSIDQLKVHFKGARLSQITPDSIEEFKQARLSSGVKSATVNRDLAVLRRMLNLAKKRRLIGQNPFGEVEFLDERKLRRRPHILTFDEQTKLLAVARSHLRLLVVLITETGLRVGKEALPLKWENVDLKNDVVRVHDSKTLAGRREVPLSAFCKEELLRWKKLTGPDFSPYIFFNPSRPGTYLRAVRKVWASALKNAKINYFRIYDLRATFSSRLSAAGVPDVFVSQMMGHAGGLLQTYSKAIVEYRRDAIHKLEELRQSQLAPSDSCKQTVLRPPRPRQSLQATSLNEM